MNRNVLQLPIQACRGAYFPYFKIHAPIFCCPLFFEEYPNPQVRMDKMINELTIDYNPSPWELTSRIHPLIFLWRLWRTFLESFFKLLYTTMVVEIFQIYCVKITWRYIFESRNWIYSFLVMPLNKTLPQNRKKLPILPKQHFLKIYFSPSRKRGRLCSWKNDQNCTCKSIMIINFDKYYDLCDLYISGFFKVL